MLEHCDFEEQKTVAGEDGYLRPDMVVCLPGRRARSSSTPRSRSTRSSNSSRRTTTRPARYCSRSTPSSCARTSTSWPRRSTGASSNARRSSWWPSSPGSRCWRLRSTPTPPCRSTRWTSGSSWRRRARWWPMLRTIALSWQQETLAENAREVRELGAELYERLRTWTGHMAVLQKSLTSSVDAYNRAVGSLESTRPGDGAQVPRPGRGGQRASRDHGAAADRERRPAISKRSSPTTTRSARRRAVEHLVAARGHEQRPAARAPAGLTRPARAG